MSVEESEHLDVSFRRLPTLVYWLLALALLLVAMRLLLPSVLRDALNHRLAQMGSYSGHMESLDVDLWRGAYRMHNLVVVKSGREIQLPLLEVPQLEFALSWLHLFRGHLVAEARFDSLVLNLVDADDAAARQLGAGVDWVAQLGRYSPFALNEVSVHDGSLRLHKFDASPPLTLSISAVDAQITNMANAEREETARFARLEAYARLLGAWPVQARARFATDSHRADFDLDLLAAGVQLPALNDALREYAHVEFTSGSGELLLKLHAREGDLTGYLRPQFFELQGRSSVAAVADRDSTAEMTASSVIEDAEADTEDLPVRHFDRTIQLVGRSGDPQAGVLSTVGSALHDALNGDGSTTAAPATGHAAD